MPVVVCCAARVLTVSVVQSGGQLDQQSVHLWLQKLVAEVPCMCASWLSVWHAAWRSAAACQRRPGSPRDECLPNQRLRLRHCLQGDASSWIVQGVHHELRLYRQSEYASLIHPPGLGLYVVDNHSMHHYPPGSLVHFACDMCAPRLSLFVGN